MSIDSDFCRAPNCEKFRDKKQGSSLCTMHRVRRSRYKSFEIPIRPGLPKDIAMICIHHGNRTIKQVYKAQNCNRCIECRKISGKKHRQANPNKKMTRNFYFIGKKENRIKIAKQDFDDLFIEQNGVCKICQNLEVKNNSSKKNPQIKRLSVDHCHKSHIEGITKIRGLLCTNCNLMIGYAKDNIEILESAIQYLKNSKND